MVNAASRPRRRHPCRGIASVEFVLGLPFLLLAAAIAFGFAAAGLAAVEAQVRARHDAWQGRGPVGTGRTFAVAAGGPGDLASRTATERFRVASALKFVGTTAEARHSVLAGTWDHRDAPFADPGSPFTPHVDLIEKLFAAAATGAGSALQLPAGVDRFAAAGDPASSPAITQQSSGPPPSGAGSDALLARANAAGPFPADKLREVPGAGSAADRLSEKSSDLTGRIGQARSGSFGGLGSLAHGGAEGPNAMLAAGRVIFEGIDAALEPLDDLIGALDDLVGSGKKKDGGGIVGDIEDAGKSAIATVTKAITGLFGDDVEKDVKKLVGFADRLDDLRKLGLPFKKLVEAAEDRDAEAPDEFSAGKSSIYGALRANLGDWK